MNKTKNLALCGVFAALSISVLILGNLIGIGLYIAPALAMAFLIPILDLCKKRLAFITYISISILCLIFISDPELSITYISFGWYPIIQPYIYKIKKLWLRLLVLFSIYSLIIFTIFTGLYALLGILPLLKESKAISIALFFIGALTFILLDLALLKINFKWKTKWKKYLKT